MHELSQVQRYPIYGSGNLVIVLWPELCNQLPSPLTSIYVMLLVRVSRVFKPGEPVLDLASAAISLPCAEPLHCRK